MRRASAAAWLLAMLFAAIPAACRGPVAASSSPDAPASADSSATAASSASARLAADPARAPRERGIAWLVANQNEDGSWGSFESARSREIYLGTQASHRAFRDATSALATMALVEPAGRDAAARAALERAVGYLVATEPSRRVNSDTFYNVWTHTYLVAAAAETLRSGVLPHREAALRELLEREVRLLLAARGADGGWGYYDFAHHMATPSGNHTTSFNTASALLALEAAAAAGVETPPEVIREAVAVVQRLRLPSGAYVYGTYAQLRPAATFNMVPGSLARSQPCNLALHRFGGGVSIEEVEQGLRQLREEHRYLQIGLGRPAPHEAYYQNSGYYYLYGHYYAGRAIERLPEPSRSEFRAWLHEVLAGVQNPDGSWLDFPLYGYGHAYGTAYAVLALRGG